MSLSREEMIQRYCQTCLYNDCRLPVPPDDPTPFCTAGHLRKWKRKQKRQESPTNWQYSEDFLGRALAQSDVNHDNLPLELLRVLSGERFQQHGHKRIRAELLRRQSPEWREWYKRAAAEHSD